MKQKVELMMSILLLVSAFFLARGTAAYVMNQQEGQQEQKGQCIVVDAGHGGSDSGKVGVNGELEKDINLQMAKKLQEVLEQEGFQVVLTRDEDRGLYDENAQNQKVQDLKNRCQLIDENNPVLTISIHQNSYTSPDVSGAQVFFYATSIEGKKLAESIQHSLVDEVDPENHRVEKANDTYYLLKKTSSPIVIVECGFLSNPEEAEKLTTEEYQDQIVQAIKDGILGYLRAGVASPSAMGYFTDTINE